MDTHSIYVFDYMLVYFHMCVILWSVAHYLTLQMLIIILLCNNYNTTHVKILSLDSIVTLTFLRFC